MMNINQNRSVGHGCEESEQQARPVERIELGRRHADSCELYTGPNRKSSYFSIPVAILWGTNQTM